MSAEPVWIDGAVVDGARAQIGADDRGFLLGHGAFETLRFAHGAIKRWPAHLVRLEGGLAYMGVDRPAILDEVPSAARQLAQASGLADGVARLTVSAGGGGGGLQHRAGFAPRVVLALRPRPSPPAAVAVRIAEGARRSGSPGERFKLSGYADLIAARREAVAAGDDRAVVTGPGGVLACADCANLFWILKGRLFTPALETGALAGVTRAALIEAAAASGRVVEEAAAPPDALMGAETAFMTNAVEGLTAISSVNGIGKEVDHPMLGRLRAVLAGDD